MTSHSLSIAKASLLASCLRPDFTKLTRDDLTEFHSLLEVTISHCSPSNIQKSKDWLFQHVLPSPGRTAALGKFFTAVSKNIIAVNCRTTVRPRRRRLHLLYLVNDILHHLKHHENEVKDGEGAVKELVKTLPALFADALEYAGIHSKARLKQLLTIWRNETWCSPSTVDQLTAALTTGKSIQVDTADTSHSNVKRELPWVMPATHGDPAAPFFDLPAANFMPHIVPSSNRPMRPDRVRALQLTAGVADNNLVNAVKDFLKDVETIDNPFAGLEDDGIVPSIDDMGQVTYKNEAGDVMGDTYYGWSRSFCEKMQQKGKGAGKGSRSSSRSVSRSRSRSQSLSRSPGKRRRYSSSRSRSRSPSPLRPSFSKMDHDRRQVSTGFTPQAFAPAQAQDTRTFQQPALPPHPLPPPGMHNGMVPPPRPPNWHGPWPPPPPPPQSSGHSSNFLPPQQHGSQYQHR